MSSFEDETDRFLAAWMQVRQMVQAANFNRFQREGLSATQFMTMNVLPPTGLTLTALATKLNLSPASLNKTVDSLEVRGLVRRTRNPHDARKTDIVPTKTGVDVQNSSSREFRRYMARIFAAMNRTQREGLLAGLEQMVRLGEQPPAAATTIRDADAPREKRNSRRSPRH